MVLIIYVVQYNINLYQLYKNIEKNRDYGFKKIVIYDYT